MKKTIFDMPKKTMFAYMRENNIATQDAHSIKTPIRPFGISPYQSLLLSYALEELPNCEDAQA